MTSRLSSSGAAASSQAMRVRGVITLSAVRSPRRSTRLTMLRSSESITPCSCAFAHQQADLLLGDAPRPSLVDAAAGAAAARARRDQQRTRTAWRAGDRKRIGQATAHGESFPGRQRPMRLGTSSPSRSEMNGDQHERRATTPIGRAYGVEPRRCRRAGIGDHARPSTSPPNAAGASACSRVMQTCTVERKLSGCFGQAQRLARAAAGRGHVLEAALARGQQRHLRHREEAVDRTSTRTISRLGSIAGSVDGRQGRECGDGADGRPGRGCSAVRACAAAQAGIIACQRRRAPAARAGRANMNPSQSRHSFHRQRRHRHVLPADDLRQRRQVLRPARTSAAAAAHESTKALHAMLKAPARALAGRVQARAPAREGAGSRRSARRWSTRFVTALEREDIEALASALYKIPKTVEKFAERYALLADRLDGVDFAPRAAMLEKAAGVIVRDGRAAAPRLEARRDEASSTSACRRSRAEGRPPDPGAVPRHLFTASSMPAQMFLRKELFEILEKAIDRCRDAGNVDLPDRAQEHLRTPAAVDA